MEGLPEGATVTVEGEIASHGHEARGLPAGTHTVYVYGPDGKRRAFHPVMVGDHERVVLGPDLDDRGRGPIPEREEIVQADLPQWLQVALAERHTTRVYVDELPVRFELSTGTWDVQLPPGEHELSISVGGRRRHRQPIVIAGSPWRCGVDRFGTTTCVELTRDHGEGVVDVDALAERLRRAAPADRLALIEVEGRMGCGEVGELMDLFVGDASRVAVAQRLRPHVTNPGAYEVLLQRVSFSNSKHAIEALYRP